MHNRNVKKTFEILRSEITCLMDLYIVINVCFLVVVFYSKKGGGVLQKSIFI